MDHINEGNHLQISGNFCDLRPLERDTEGRVACTLVWVLPAPDLAAEGIPTTCGEVPELLTPHETVPRDGVGRERCVVNQLAVTGPEDARQVESGFGWFADDFSEKVQHCRGIRRMTITFSEGAKPPPGVTIIGECVDSRVLDGGSADEC